MAYVLYADELTRPDMAYPVLIANLLPSGLTGLMLAALIAAIMSSLDSMLNSTATIFTIDLYQRHLRPAASQSRLIAVGRLSTVVFLLMAWAWAPFLVSFERIFSYIQEFWGLITPGVAVVFLSGLFWKKATARGAAWVMGLTLPVTIGIKALTPKAAFLDQMWLAGIALFVLLAVLSLTDPAGGAVPDLVGNGEASPGLEEALREKDLLFDVLSLGAVVATVALVLFFF